MNVTQQEFVGPKPLIEPPPPPLQDESAPPIMLGGDVVALYPSMEAAPTGAMTYQAVKETQVKFEKINYKFALIFLLLSIGQPAMNATGLGHLIPTRKRCLDRDMDEFPDDIDQVPTFKNIKNSNTGNPQSLNAKVNRDLNYWEFNEQRLDDVIKKEIMARVIQVCVLVLMSTHSYTFAGKIYKQRRGAPIGLRGSACLARILMSIWDKKWTTLQKKLGLIVHLYYRYVDDIRIYLRPISKGWTWASTGWSWTGNCNQQDLDMHTKSQLKHSFESIFEFLKFTTETQEDYVEKMLPTLDFKTSTKTNGMIEFQYFHKLMENNQVLNRWTALSKGTIFSALRQNLIRRMLNTDPRVDISIRIRIIEKFIQLLRNSGHQFQFIRSIIQQALTKFHYMVERSSLPKNHKKYQPLYRPPTFKTAERIMVKYISAHVWYKKIDLNDNFRQSWKGRVKTKAKRNNTKKRGNGAGMGKVMNTDHPIDITAALFVPPTAEGKLTQMLCDDEEDLSKETGWGVKVVESSGVPLVQMLKPTFNMASGCIIGKECKICGNTGVACSVKNVIYSAECAACKTSSLVSPNSAVSAHLNENRRHYDDENINLHSAGNEHVNPRSSGDNLTDILLGSSMVSNGRRSEDNLTSNNSKSDDMKNLKTGNEIKLAHESDKKLEWIYIGETARPFRTRCREHMKKVQALSPDSFIVQHWFKHHGLNPTPPSFEFKIVKACKDALTRQVGEAVWIQDKGTLNSKSEFGMNNLCRLVADLTPWQTEEEVRQQELKRKREKEDLVQFVNVMKNVQNFPLALNHNTCRSNKLNKLAPRGAEAPAKRAKMETSTPVDLRTRREPPNISLSPTVMVVDTSDNPSDHSGPQMLVKTGISDGLDSAVLTPTRREETSQDMDVGANALWDAVSGARLLNVSFDSALPRQDISNPVSHLVDALIEGLNLSCWSTDDFTHSNNSEAEQHTSATSGKKSTDDFTHSNNSEVEQHKNATTGEKSLDLAVVECAEQQEMGEQAKTVNIVEEIQVVEGKDSFISPERAKVNLETIGGTISTPSPNSLPRTRRKLDFGVNLTPALGKQRAAPESPQVKRSFVPDLDTPESIKKKERLGEFHPTVGVSGVVRIASPGPRPTNGSSRECLIASPDPRPPTIMTLMRNRSNSTPNLGAQKRRACTYKPHDGVRGNQKKITDIFIKQGSEESSCNGSLAGKEECGKEIQTEVSDRL